MRRPNLAIMLALGGALVPDRTMLIRDHSDGEPFPILTAQDDDAGTSRAPRRRSNAASIKRKAAKARNARKRGRR